MTPPFSKVLVANRGEIAIRVFRALRELGIGAVAVYSEADADAPHVRYADEAVLLGAAAPSESYLNIERIVDAAKRTGAEAIHPGYGFLAESAPFATAVEEAGLVWIGPPASAIDAMGSKINSRVLMAEAGVPIVPGTTEEITDAARVIELGDQYGWPIALKASAGDGASSTIFWCRRCSVQSRSPRWMTLPCVSAITCISTCRGSSTYFST